MRISVHKENQNAARLDGGVSLDMIGDRRNNYKKMQTIANEVPDDGLLRVKKYHDGQHLAPLNREPRNNSYPRQIDLLEDTKHPIDKVAQTARGAKNIPAIDHSNHQIKPPQSGSSETKKPPLGRFGALEPLNK